MCLLPLQMRRLPKKMLTGSKRNEEQEEGRKRSLSSLHGCECCPSSKQSSLDTSHSLLRCPGPCDAWESHTFCSRHMQPPSRGLPSVSARQSHRQRTSLAAHHAGGDTLRDPRQMLRMEGLTNSSWKGGGKGRHCKTCGKGVGRGRHRRAGPRDSGFVSYFTAGNVSHASPVPFPPLPPLRTSQWQLTCTKATKEPLQRLNSGLLRTGQPWSKTRTRSCPRTHWCPVRLAFAPQSTFAPTVDVDCAHSTPKMRLR